MNFGASNNVSQVTVGSLAPDFRLRTDRDEVWRLSDHRDGVTVLLFYPQNETLVCTKQMCSVRDNWESYLATKGISGSRFNTNGMGIADPIATNDTAEGRTQNRRVEFAITANEKMVEDAQKQAGK